MYQKLWVTVLILLNYAANLRTYQASVCNYEGPSPDTKIADIIVRSVSNDNKSIPTLLQWCFVRLWNFHEDGLRALPNNLEKKRPTLFLRQILILSNVSGL